jgi:hypothetical protein
MRNQNEESNMNRVFVVSPKGQSEPMVPIRCADEAEELQGLLANNFDAPMRQKNSRAFSRTTSISLLESRLPPCARGGGC